MARPLGSKDTKKRKRRNSLNLQDAGSVAGTAALTGVGTASTATVGEQLLPRKLLTKLEPRSPTGMSASKKLALGGLAVGSTVGGVSKVRDILRRKRNKRFI